MNIYNFCNTCAVKAYSEVMFQLSFSNITNMPFVSLQEHFEKLADIYSTPK